MNLLGSIVTNLATNLNNVGSAVNSVVTNLTNNTITFPDKSQIFTYDKYADITNTNQIFNIVLLSILGALVITMFTLAFLKILQPYFTINMQWLLPLLLTIGFIFNIISTFLNSNTLTTLSLNNVIQDSVDIDGLINVINDTIVTQDKTIMDGINNNNSSLTNIVNNYKQVYFCYDMLDLLTIPSNISTNMQNVINTYSQLIQNLQATSLPVNSKANIISQALSANNNYTIGEKNDILTYFLSLYNKQTYNLQQTFNNTQDVISRLNTFTPIIKKLADINVNEIIAENLWNKNANSIVSYVKPMWSCGDFNLVLSATNQQNNLMFNSTLTQVLTQWNLSVTNQLNTTAYSIDNILMNSNVCGTLISISAYNMKILTVNINGVYYCLIFNNDKISHIINNLNNNYFMVDSAMSIRSSISLNNYNNQPIGLVTMDVLNNQMELISILPNNILQNIGINDATILWGDVNVILNPTSFMRKAAKFKLNNMNTLRSVGNNIIKNYSFSYINGVNLTSISIDTLTINISFYKTDIMMDINLLNNNTNIHKVSFNADSLKHAGLLNASNPLQPLQLI